MVPCIYVYLDFSVFSHFQYGFELISILFIPCFGHAYWMDFYGFTDGACHHTLNLVSTAWVLYSPAQYLVSYGYGFVLFMQIEWISMVSLMVHAIIP